MKRSRTGTYLGILCACTAIGCFETPATPAADASDASNLFPLPRPDAGTPEAGSTASCGTTVGDQPMAGAPAADTPPATGTADDPEALPLVDGSSDSPVVDVGGAVDAGSDTQLIVEPDAAAAMPAGPSAPDAEGQFLVTEVMADPAGRTDAEGEWVELLNTSDQEFDLKGCQLGEGVDSDPVFADSFVVGPGAYVAISRNTAPGFSPAAVLSMSLRNTYDVVMLRCDGMVIDSLSYDAAAQYPIVAGASLSLSPDAVASGANDSPELFCTGSTDYGGDLGTPGAPNDPCPAP